jgi:hypothetical protein
VTGATGRGGMRRDGQEEPQPKHETKAKGDGKRRKRENIVKKWQQCIFLLIYGWVLLTNLAQPQNKTTLT